MQTPGSGVALRGLEFGRMRFFVFSKDVQSILPSKALDGRIDTACVEGGCRYRGWVQVVRGGLKDFSFVLEYASSRFGPPVCMMPENSDHSSWSWLHRYWCPIGSGNLCSCVTQVSSRLCPGCVQGPSVLRRYVRGVVWGVGRRRVGRRGTTWCGAALGGGVE